VEVSLGTAARTGLADESFDVVVSANSVAAWPDLDAGILELRRVTARGGRVAIAWHGGTHPNRIARRLALPAGALDRIETALAQRLEQVTRHELTGLTVFTARRPRAPAA